MVERQDAHSDKSRSRFGVATPLDGFAAATAVGFAMTAQALDMWFGVMSGVAKASQDIFDPKDKSGEGPAYTSSGKSATAKAKWATRTVVADIERTVQDVAEVTVDLLGGKTEELPLETPVEEAPTKTADVVAFQAKPVAPARTKKAAKTAAKQQTSVAARTPAGAESESSGSVAAEISLVASNVAEAAPVDAVNDGSAGSPIARADAPEPASAPGEPVVVAKAPVAIMPEDFRQPKAVDKPELSDDLKLIVGVGPKLEKVLNGLGIWTYAQVAAWTPEEMAWVDDYLSLSGRIARDGWIAQADGLAKRMKAAG